MTVHNGPSPALVLDCRGRRCPLPVIELARRIADVAPGSVIGVAADDPAARLDIPAWCRMRSQTYLGETPAPDGVPTYLVRRASSPDRP
jgi:tRNA 2-thiouridine synthesizing protein A